MPPMPNDLRVVDRGQRGTQSLACTRRLGFHRTLMLEIWQQVGGMHAVCLYSYDVTELGNWKIVGVWDETEFEYWLAFAKPYLSNDYSKWKHYGEQYKESRTDLDSPEYVVLTAIADAVANPQRIEPVPTGPRKLRKLIRSSDGCVST